MTYQQKQVALQPMETVIEPGPLPFQEHCTTALPFITVPDEDSAYALQVAPHCDSAMLPQGIENLEGKRDVNHSASTSDPDVYRMIVVWITMQPTSHQMYKNIPMYTPVRESHLHGLWEPLYRSRESLVNAGARTAHLPE